MVSLFWRFPQSSLNSIPSDDLVLSLSWELVNFNPKMLRKLCAQRSNTYTDGLSWGRL